MLHNPTVEGNNQVEGDPMFLNKYFFGTPTAAGNNRKGGSSVTEFTQINYA